MYFDFFWLLFVCELVYLLDVGGLILFHLDLFLIFNFFIHSNNC